MLKYLYDGSFDGLLTALFHVLELGENPAGIEDESNYTPDLFSEYQSIISDTVVAKKMLSTVRARVSRETAYHVYYVFLSEAPELGTALMEYLSLGWDLGKKVDENHADARVRRVHQISQRVGKEHHRLLGLLRFRELREQVFYAPCEPDYNVLPLLAPHFVRRMGGHHWIIHDLRRLVAVVYNQEEWVMTPFEFTDVPYWSNSERTYQGLWQEFYGSIAIKGRTNPKAQKRCMPIRYWKYLTEKRV